MGKYEETRVKLTNSQPNRNLQQKNKTGTTLRITKKNFRSEELPHKLLPTTRQKTKIRNAFLNNMSTGIKVRSAQLFNIIQSGGFLGTLFSKLAGPLMKVAVSLAKNAITPSATMVSGTAIDDAI